MSRQYIIILFMTNESKRYFKYFQKMHFSRIVLSITKETAQLLFLPQSKESSTEFLKLVIF